MPRPKRKTKASVARERGLEPLAERLWQQQRGDDPMALAKEYLSEEVADEEAALAGARDILAEQIADDAALRGQLRTLYQKKGVLETKSDRRYRAKRL